MKTIQWLSHLKGEDPAVWGQALLDLSAIDQAGVPVLPAFVLAPSVQAHFFLQPKLRRSIQRACTNLSTQAPQEFVGAAHEIRALIAASPFLGDEHAELKHIASTFRHHLVSATDRPLPIQLSTPTAFASHPINGILDGVEELEQLIKHLWSLTFTDRALYQRYRDGEGIVPPFTSTLVQYYPAPTYSGMAQGSDTDALDDSILTLTVQAGLAKPETQSVDTYRFDRKSLTVLSRSLHLQWWAEQASGKVTSAKQLNQKVDVLSEDHLSELARLIRTAQESFADAHQFHWVRAGSRFWITGVERLLPSTPQLICAEPFLRGVPACVGRVVGRVRQIRTKAEAVNIQKGEIVVVSHLSSRNLEWLSQAGGMLAEHGTATGIEAASARRVGIPAVVGVSKALSRLRDGQLITLDGTEGVIYQGDCAQENNYNLPTQIITGTKVYASLSDPYQALSPEQVSRWDGVGVLHGDAILKLVGLSLEDIMARGYADEYVDVLTEGLERVLSQTISSPVLFRLYDSNPHPIYHDHPRRNRPEPNQALGFRGTHRLLKHPELLDLEMTALARLADRGLTNFGIVLPLVRSSQELGAFADYLAETPLARLYTPPIWVSCETPAVAILADELCATGIAGMLIDVPALGRLVSGVDHENYQVAHVADPAHPALIQAIRYAVATCRHMGVLSIIASEMEELSPEVVEEAVRCGVTGVSVLPERIGDVRHLIASVEQRMLLEHTLNTSAA